MAAMARVDAFPAPARAAFSSAPRGLFESPGELVCELLVATSPADRNLSGPAAGRLCRRLADPSAELAEPAGTRPRHRIDAAGASYARKFRVSEVTLIRRRAARRVRRTDRAK